MPAVQVVDIETPLGLARAHVTPASGAGTLVLGHGAGGGIEAPDLLAVTAAAADAGWQVARIEQPWRVAGKRVAPAPARLDEAWAVVLDRLRADGLVRGPLVLGGRSAGARVACRTADVQGADGVLALAFPLTPPGRPEKTRAAELTAVQVPIVVVQGERDAFGSARDIAAVLTGRPGASVYGVSGDHSLKHDPVLVGAAALAGLAELRPGAAGDGGARPR
jgi:predicted alpha/beta-hydrolase family hydrolase